MEAMCRRRMKYHPEGRAAAAFSNFLALGERASLCKSWKGSKERVAEKLGFGIKLTQSVRHVTLGSYMSSLGLSFQRCKMG